MPSPSLPPSRLRPARSSRAGSRRPGARPRRALAALALVAVCLPGCITRTVDTPLLDSSDVQIWLRHQEKGGKPIDRGFQQPVVISSQRLAHILALVDVRTGDAKVEERQAAISSDMLEPLSSGLSQALRDADSSQQIVVMAIERERRLGVFTRKFLTSFIAFVQDEDLFLDFNRIRWEIPKQREDRLPKPELADSPMKFRVAGSQAMFNAGPQTLVVDWRSDLFRQPVGMQSDRGEIRRRTVLMESPGARRGPTASDGPPLPPGLSPDDLRALADLEDARRSGEITESDYQRQRGDILDRAQEAAAP